MYAKSSLDRLPTVLSYQHSGPQASLIHTGPWSINL